MQSQSKVFWKKHIFTGSQICKEIDILIRLLTVYIRGKRITATCGKNMKGKIANEDQYNLWKNVRVGVGCVLTQTLFSRTPQILQFDFSPKMKQKNEVWSESITYHACRHHRVSSAPLQNHKKEFPLFHIWDSNWTNDRNNSIITGECDYVTKSVDFIWHHHEKRGS